MKINTTIGRSVLKNLKSVNQSLVSPLGFGHEPKGLLKRHEMCVCVVVCCVRVCLPQVWKMFLSTFSHVAWSCKEKHVFFLGGVGDIAYPCISHFGMANGITILGGSVANKIPLKG